MFVDLKSYPAHKPAGVEWLGEVPAHWAVLPLCAVGKPKSITDQQQRELLSVYLDRGVIRFSEVNEKRTNVTSEDLSKYQAVDPGDFVLNNQQAWRGSVGVSSYSGIVSPAYLVLSLSPGLSAGFANLLFRGRAMVAQYLVCSRGVGSIQRNLYWPHLKRVVFPSPPLCEQIAIVRFLDHADRRIRLYIRAKQKLIALLEEQKQAIIHQAVTGQIDVRTGQPYPTYKASSVKWLADVPAHWEVLPLYAVGTPKSITGQEQQELLSVYLDRGVIRFSEVEEKRTNVTSEDLSKYQAVDPGDFVLNNQQAWRGSVGVSSHSGIVSPAYLVLSLSPRLYAGFANLLFRDRVMVTQYLVCSRGVGSIQRNLYWPHLKRVIFPLPPLFEQAAIIRFLDSATADIASAIADTQREIDLLREYRTRLIADVVTGKLDVREAADTLPEIDPLAADDELDKPSEADANADSDELDAAGEEVEA